MSTLPNVELFSDGACRGNPGPGGYGVILRYNGREKEFSGGDGLTTNNKMELMGVITGLKALKKPCSVTVYTDSRYVCDGIEKGWAKSWRAKGWKRAGGEPALNSDLWQQLLELTELHTVRFVWIRGHAGHPENERCDALATAAASLFQKN